MNIFKRFRKIEDKISFLCDREYEKEYEILKKKFDRELEELDMKHEQELKVYDSKKLWAARHHQDNIQVLKRKHGKEYKIRFKRYERPF